TGLYSSPHLISITERIRINGTDISEDEFARTATHVRETAEYLLADGDLEYRPTFFEQVTAIALVAFAKAKVELEILETGLGGRLDATTAANAEIAAITRIDYDHQEYLGETIEEIAAEKAAIIHEGSRVVIADQKPEAMDTLLKRCQEYGITPRTYCRVGIWAIDSIKKSAVVLFETDNDIYDDPNLGLKGRHQVENAGVAVMLSEVLTHDFSLKIDKEQVVDGLEKARHPGRLEYQDSFLFDGAHNIGGAKALADYIREFESRPITLVFGAMREKNVSAILEILAPLAQRIIITEPSNSRSLSYNELLEQLPAEMSKEKTFATDNVISAIDIANRVTPDEGIILVTGSLYLVGEAKKILNN
ncbi:MAG: Mur ligase family protein, partial [Acidobacteriota bacterium]